LPRVQIFIFKKMKLVKLKKREKINSFLKLKLKLKFL
jgi:hypothetical protein